MSITAGTSAPNMAGPSLSNLFLCAQRKEVSDLHH